MPTSLVSSILNFVLELYIIIRSLSLMQPPRPKLSIVQDARIVQAGSLLLFELLVVVPYATFTSLTAEFVTYSIGALGVLGKLNLRLVYEVIWKTDLRLQLLLIVHLVKLILF